MPTIDGDYCGCCGREMRGGGWFCRDCAGHVLPVNDGTFSGRSPWDRTYFAQHKRDCPFGSARSNAPGGECPRCGSLAGTNIDCPVCEGEDA